MAFRVNDKFRKNPLSIRPGGCSVFVQDSSGRVIEYDKVKNPYKYIRILKENNPSIKRVWWK